MKILTATVVFILIELIPSPAISQDYNILKQGAKGDGKTLNTSVIQRTIDKCSRTGGGTIYFPPGEYLTGSIVLKSNVTLRLGKSATLLGSIRLKDYLSIQPDYVALRTGEPTKQLIFAEGQENIAIVGEGTINGQGEAFINEGKGGEGTRRPHVLQFINCKDVKIEGITMINSGAWMQHFLACRGLQIKGIKVYNHSSYNNDGLDIDGCQNVTVSDCIIDSDDDGIVLKSTSPSLSENIVIANCVISSHCNAIKMGTESTGGFRNISISNCVISPSSDTTPIYGAVKGQSAIAIEMVDGGILERVTINNISAETNTPIFIRLGNRGRRFTDNVPEPPVGILKHVNISNVIARTSSKISSSITGIPGYPVKNITLNNIQIINTSIGEKEDIDIVIPEKIKAYPAADMFGTVLPASGFYVRHADNISFNNIQIFANDDNARPAYFFDDVQNVLINLPVLRNRHQKTELIRQVNSSNITVLP